jgi:hypothetical protein
VSYMLLAGHTHTDTQTHVCVHTQAHQHQTTQHSGHSRARPYTPMHVEPSNVCLTHALSRLSGKTALPGTQAQARNHVMRASVEAHKLGEDKQYCVLHMQQSAPKSCMMRAALNIEQC